MSDHEVINLANQLCRKFYAQLGYCVQAGFRFDLATHPQQKMCWHMAADAFDLLKHTDLSEALSNTEDV